MRLQLSTRARFRENRRTEPVIEGPAIGVTETGVTALFAGMFLLAYGWFGARYPMVSPRLAADTLEREQHH